MRNENANYRLTPLVPERLTDPQRAVYDAIARGPRMRAGASFRLVEEDGSLTGPFDAMLHAPAVGMSLQQLGAALRYESSLSERDREVATLAVAGARRCGFEWYAHEAAARRAGVPPPDLARLRAGEHMDLSSPRDRAVALAAVEVLTRRLLSDDRLAALREWLPLESVIDLVVLVGYYDLLAVLMTALRSPMPRGVADPFA